MCGVAGIIKLDNTSPSSRLLKAMTESIKHRGPDGEGQWIEDNVGLGHRRLAIIDLSPAGHQPMFSADDRYVLSYNGEIYNFKELRKELQKFGYQFKSKTDSEVVLYALVKWGAKALNRFNGMFALALWDRKEKIMLLARDRYGIKPLYYAQQGNFIAFGSEQKAILAIPEFQKHLDKAALLEYFTFQNILTDKTLLIDINILPAGYYAKINLGQNEKKLQLTQYWDFNFHEPKEKVGDHEYREELERLFNQAVNRQLLSDVEVGSYLSGGIDSASITSISAKTYPKIKTFTCGFDLNSASGVELEFDERKKAERLSKFLHTDHYETILKSGDMEKVMPKLTWHLEEPRVGQSYPNYYAAELASKYVKVVLSGSGGDEIFGGYPWRYYRGISNINFENFIDKYYQFWQRLIPNSKLKDVFSPIWKDVDDVWTRDIFCNVFKHHTENLYSNEDYINHSLYFEAKTFLHGLLVVEDKLSMAHGLEARVPFLDNDLVDFATRCPVHLKLNNLSKVIKIDENEEGNKKDKYFKKNRDGKQILRDVMKNYIPDDVVKAPKQGFSAPDASWFREDSLNFVKEKLYNSDAKIYENLDKSSVQALVNEHLHGKVNRRLLIWSLLNIEEWMQTFH